VRRLGLFATVALAVGIVVPASVAAAKPPPTTFTAVVSDDGACTLVATGTWPTNAKVTNPLASWYMDGLDLAHFVFAQDTDRSHQNPGIIKGNKVTFTVGLLTADTVSHDWYVRLDFYAKSGALLNQTWSAADSVNCGLG
jgi:hypothetical protein